MLCLGERKPRYFVLTSISMQKLILLFVSGQKLYCKTSLSSSVFKYHYKPKFCLTTYWFVITEKYVRSNISSPLRKSGLYVHFLCV